MRKLTVYDLKRACEMFEKSGYKDGVILSQNEDNPYEYESVIDLCEFVEAVKELVNGHPTKYVNIIKEYEDKKGE